MCLSNSFEKYPFLVNFPVIIDVNNVAYDRNNGQKKPLLDDVLLFINYLIKIGFSKDQIYSICDSKLRYNIDKNDELYALIDDGLIKPAPAGKSADEFILSLALKFPFCFIVSNDLYREYNDQLPGNDWLHERKITFMFLGENLCLSPNIGCDKIKELHSEEPQIEPSINKEQECSALRINNFFELPTSNEKEITTLEALKRIEESPGELKNLF